MAHLSTLLVVLLLTLLVCNLVAAQPPPGFKLHGKFLGIGGCLNTKIAPGPEAGSERLYASHIHGGDTLDIVAVNPLTGKSDVFPSPLPSECGAWAMVVGPDKQVYIGTLPSAHVMKVDWQQRKLVDLGRPSETEQYIWQLALGSDNKLYGCTYPSAKLVSFDPATGKGEDLGRMSETEQYARNVACDAKGWVYIGIGTSKQDIVAYEIATGKHKSLLTPDQQTPGTGNVILGADGKVHGLIGKWMILEGGEALPSPGDAGPSSPSLKLSDGRTVSYTGKTVTVHATDGTADEHPTGYLGKSQGIFRLGLGPDGRIYGSTAMPIHFFWADPDGDKWEEIANAGGGEFYSFLPWKDKLIGAAYSAPSPVMLYDPSKPWAPGTKATDNPWQIHYEGENAGWRPQALIAGPGDMVYIGAVSGYGELGGPICVYDPAAGKIDQYRHVVQDQSVVSLAALPSGLIVGGTTIGGGGGSHPTQTEAKLILWDPVKREKVFEMVPAPGKGTVEALAVGRNRLVYGFAADVMFVFDATERKLVSSGPQTMGGMVYNAVAPGPDGVLYGLASGGIFSIDEATHTQKLVASYPGGISGGFAIRGRDIFFHQGPQVISYHLPE